MFSCQALKRFSIPPRYLHPTHPDEKNTNLNTQHQKQFPEHDMEHNLLLFRSIPPTLSPHLQNTSCENRNGHGSRTGRLALRPIQTIRFLFSIDFLLRECLRCSLNCAYTPPPPPPDGLCCFRQNRHRPASRSPLPNVHAHPNRHSIRNYCRLRSIHSHDLPAAHREIATSEEAFLLRDCRA